MTTWSRYDALTYAGNRPNLDDVGTGSSSSAATWATAPWSKRPWPSTTSTPWSTSPPSRTTAWPSSIPACSSGPTCWAPRPCSRRHGARDWPASTTSRPARSTATWPSTVRRALHRGQPVPASHALQRIEGRRRPRRAGLRRDLRAARHHHQLLQQLRPLPVPREGHPALHHPRPRRPSRCPSTPRPRTAASGCTWSTTAGPSRRCSSTGPARRDLPRGQRDRGLASRRSPTWSSTTLGKPRVAEGDRPRPPGPRPSLPARLGARSTATLGWRPEVAFDEGLAETVALVRRPPGLVGAAASTGPRWWRTPGPIRTATTGRTTSRGIRSREPDPATGRPGR